MKEKPTVLYIETEPPTHNSELHTDFLKSMCTDGLIDIVAIGPQFLKKIFPKYIYLNKRLDIYKQLDRAALRVGADAVLTYNKNGSWYGVKDNIALYSWAQDAISRLSLPKFHITTDYCRDGFHQDQSEWFCQLGYSAAIFRHKVSLEYDCSVDKYWLPFSVDRRRYSGLARRAHSSRCPKVSFAGTAFQFPDLYRKRIAAIKALDSAGVLATPRVVDRDSGRLQMITGSGYQKFLSRYKFGLTCGGTCNFMTAKYFQIPASGSILVCSDTHGLELFPEDLYLVFDEKNIDDLISKVSFYNKNKKYAEEVASKLTGFVLKNHNNKIRGQQLLGIIKNYI